MKRYLVICSFVVRRVSVRRRITDVAQKGGTRNGLMHKVVGLWALRSRASHVERVECVLSYVAVDSRGCGVRLQCARLQYETSSESAGLKGGRCMVYDGRERKTQKSSDGSEVAQRSQENIENGGRTGYNGCQSRRRYAPLNVERGRTRYGRKCVSISQCRCTMSMQSP